MKHTETGLSPAFFPELAFFFLITLSVFLLILNIIKWHRKEIGDKVTEKLDKGQIRQVGTVLFILLVYIHMISVIGYFISSFLTLIIFILNFKVREWYKILVLPVILLLLVFLFFEKGLMILLPRGILF